MKGEVEWMAGKWLKMLMQADGERLVECPPDASCSVGVEVCCLLLCKSAEGNQILSCGIQKVNWCDVKSVYWSCSHIE